MLDEMDSQIDAVVVSTPNHIHAPASVTAMRMGKHCYCEKPLTHSVYEARVAAQVAAEKKLATQMGTQIHASDNFRRVVELIRAGAIGPVREVPLLAPRRRLAPAIAPRRPRRCPRACDWDLWLGPAPERPYHPCYVPHDWHYWWDFGGGAFGNMGCHYLDLAFWALDLRHPDDDRGRRAAGPSREHARAAGTSATSSPPAASMPPVTLTWNHGAQSGPRDLRREEVPALGLGRVRRRRGDAAGQLPQAACCCPRRSSPTSSRPSRPSRASIGHHQEWIDACKTGSPTTCNFDYSGAVTETVLLGNVAYRAGKKLAVGRGSHEVPQLPRGRRAPPARVPQGMDVVTNG